MFIDLNFVFVRCRRFVFVLLWLLFVFLLYRGIR